MGRTPWFDADGMRKGDWTGEEDQKLVAYITQHGTGDWGSLPKRAGLQRCGKSCRLRWLNYLKPGIKRGKFTPQEEEEIIKLHAELGNRWAEAIAKQMHNRTDNDIKNHWNSCLKKRLARSGINPKTHGPKNLTVDVTSPSSTASSQTLSSSSSISPSSSSTSSAHFLNKLAAGISSHGSLEKIKTVILSERPRETVDEEEKMMMDMKDDEVIACFLEIEESLNTTLFDDENLNETPTFSEELRYDNSTATTTAFDDYSSNALHGFDFYDETEQFGDMFLL